MSQELEGCQGCGHVSNASPAETPRPAHCGHCPPWVCEYCGEWDSLNGPCCCCWTSLDGMALADLKALFATSDMSLGGLGAIG